MSDEPSFSTFAALPYNGVSLDLPTFRLQLPDVVRMIEEALRSAQHRIPLSELGIHTLDPYFTVEPLVLERLQVVVVDAVPQLPFERFALPDMARLFPTSQAGIVFGAVLFVHESFAVDESLYFHELIHFLQMDLLGLERFLDIYVTGLVVHGYRENPLERIALELQNRFDSGEAPFHLPALVRKLTREIDLRFRDGAL